MSKLLVILGFSFIAYFLISLPFFSGDVKNHIVWGKSLVEKGTVGFYERQFHDFSFPNYPPVSMGLFALAILFFQGISSLVNFFNTNIPIFPSNLVYFFQWENTLVSFLKLPAILPGIGLGYLIYLFKPKIWPVIIFLINPAIIYLAVIWGQNDLLQFFFIILAFYFLFIKKLWPSFLAAGLAILSKQTALVLWVVFLVAVFRQYGWKKVILAILTTVILFYLAYLPFHQFSLTWPFEFYNKTLTYSTGFLISDNALNFWGAVSNFEKVDAAQNIILIPWVWWGYLIFLIFFTPLTYLFLKSKFSNERLFHYAFIVSLIYFFTLTRMHERYLIPAVILISILVSFNKKYWASLIFVTVFHFLNLYRGLYLPFIPMVAYFVKSIIFLQTLVVLYSAVMALNLYQFIKSKND